VRRGLAVAQIVEGATVTDSNGEVVDTSEFFSRGDDEAPEAPEAAAETAEADEETADAK